MRVRIPHRELKCRKDKAMKLVADSGACYGCRICELVCSFHRKRVFSPALSSIRVSTNNLTGQVELSIDSTCDLCQEEEQPLCVAYCIYGALKEANKDD